MLMGGETIALLLVLAVLASSSSIAPEPGKPRPQPQPQPQPKPRTKLSLDDLFWLAISAGFTGNDAKIAAAVAMAESGGNPRALGDKGTSYGLWQIHQPAWPQAFENGRDMYDPANNAQTAHDIFVKVGNFTPWTTYRTGAHKRFLAELTRKR